MRFTGSSLLLALAAVTVVSGQKQYQKSTLQTNEKTLAVGLTPINRLMPRQGSAGSSDFCSGRYVTCASCFGSGYTECSDGVTCYNPSDPTTSCSSSSSSSSGSSSSSSSGSSSGSSSSSSSGSGTSYTSDYCYGKSCSSCFGAGYIECSDGVTCYDPSDSTTSCSTSSGSSSGSGTSSGSAESGSTLTTTASHHSSTSTSTTSVGSSQTTSTSSSGSSGSSESSGSSGSSGTSGAPSTGATVHPNNAAAISTPMGVSAGLGGLIALFAAVAI